MNAAKHAGWFGGRLAGLCAIALGAALALLLCGCTGSSQKTAETLKTDIAGDMDRLTSITSETAVELFVSDYTDGLVGAGVDPATVYGPMFSGLTYEFGDVTVDGDQASVALTITNKDLTAALQNYTTAITNELATSAGRESLAALDEAGLTRHFAELLVQCLEDATLGTVSTTVELSYAKVGAAWELQDSTALTDALLGGLNEALVADPAGTQAAEATDGAAADAALAVDAAAAADATATDATDAAAVA